MTLGIEDKVREGRAGTENEEPNASWDGPLVIKSKRASRTNAWESAKVILVVSCY